ncbi:FecR family protein [Pedobacter immunditicola]|uniref:FecR family protein n=1 Tax=Pedobacter immunditicola TaxID=3133440 RepID=UPI0030A7DC9D
MNLHPYKLADLIARHIQEKLSAEESVCLLEWLNESEDNQRLFDRLVKAEQVKDSFDFFDALDVDAAWKKADRTRKIRSIKKAASYLGYAAALAGIIFSFLIFLPQEQTSPQEPVSVVKVRDLPPGGEKATLKLSNGEVVQLDENYIKISELKGFLIFCKGGELNYSGTSVVDNHLVYNTLSVPKRGTYRVVLADGTKVWLNSLSEIQFPVQFSHTQRSVKLTGEAYFEVAPDPLRPFFVEVNDKTIEVLGTHFNVNSYGAQMKTTLLEGKVKISNSFAHKFLVPGQEADVVGKDILVKRGDLKKALAWRNNEFYFKNESMHEVLREISRWYDFKINDDQMTYNKRFSGSINRDLKLSELLKILHSLSGYQFKFDGTTVFISNQSFNHNSPGPQKTK